MSAVKTERPAQVKDEHLDYLDQLRETGETNMYGATRYVSDQFGLSLTDADVVVGYWMEQFGSER